MQFDTDKVLVNDYIVASEDLLKADVFITQIGDIKLDFSNNILFPRHALRGRFVKSTRYSGKIGDEYDLCVFQDSNNRIPNWHCYSNEWLQFYCCIKDTLTSIVVAMKKLHDGNYEAVTNFSEQCAVMLRAMIDPAKLIHTIICSSNVKQCMYGMLIVPSVYGDDVVKYLFYCTYRRVSYNSTETQAIVQCDKVHVTICWSNSGVPKIVYPTEQQECIGIKIVNMSYMHHWLSKTPRAQYEMMYQYFGYVKIEKNCTCANCIHEDNETKKKEVLANTYLQVKDIKVASGKKNDKNWVDMDVKFYSYNPREKRWYFVPTLNIHNMLIVHCIFKDKNGKICKQTYEDTTRIAKMCDALYSVLTFHVASAEMVGFEYQLKDQSCKDTFNVLSPDFLIKSNDIQHEREATRLLGHPLPKLDDVKEEEKESGSSYPRYDLAIVFENFFANVDVRKNCMLFYRALTLQEIYKEKSFMNLYQCLLDYIDENFSKIDGKKFEFGLKVLFKCQQSKDTLTSQEKEMQKELCKECFEVMFYKTWDTREEDLDEFIQNIDIKIKHIAEDIADIRNAIAHGREIPKLDYDFDIYYACLCKITYYAMLRNLGILHNIAMRFLPIVRW